MDKFKVVKAKSKSEIMDKTTIKRLIKQEIKAVQEIKSFDTGFAQTVDSTGTLQKLTTIPQGDTDSTRDGDALKLCKFEFRGQSNFADSTNATRLLIFRWNQDDSSAAPAGITDLLQTATPFSPFNRDNERARKFDIIVDHLFVTANCGPGTEKLEVIKEMRSKIAFQASANTGTGHIYSAMVSDSTATTHPGLNYVVRVYFTDS